MLALCQAGSGPSAGPPCTLDLIYDKPEAPSLPNTMDPSTQGGSSQSKV